MLLKEQIKDEFNFRKKLLEKKLKFPKLELENDSKTCFAYILDNSYILWNIYLKNNKYEIDVIKIKSSIYIPCKISWFWTTNIPISYLQKYNLNIKFIE